MNSFLISLFFFIVGFTLLNFVKGFSIIIKKNFVFYFTDNDMDPTQGLFVALAVLDSKMQTLQTNIAC